MKKIFIVLFLFISASVFAQKPRVDATGYKDSSAAKKTELVAQDATRKWIVYDDVNTRFEYWDGDSWEPLGGSGSFPGFTSLLADYGFTNNSANWNTAYTNRITSLTTTGTSGAATLVGNVLNIPQYAGGGSVTYGTTAGTAAEGNDSRILNGATAFGWGDWNTGVDVSFIQGLGFVTGAHPTVISAFTNDTGYLSSVNIVDIVATGTPSGSTYLRGDGVWSTVSSGTTSTKEDFTATASQTAFVLSSTPNNVDVWINGEIQREVDNYTLSTNTVTLTVAADLNDIVIIRKY